MGRNQYKLTQHCWHRLKNPVEAHNAFSGLACNRTCNIITVMITSSFCCTIIVNTRYQRLFLLFLAAFESLSDLIKDKLQESLDQSTLEQHLKVLEALIKHWQGEVLSVSVTRTAEGCKIFLLLTSHVWY